MTYNENPALTDLMDEVAKVSRSIISLMSLKLDILFG